MGISKIVEAAWNLISPTSRLKGSWKKYIHLTEFDIYVGDASTIFEHAKGYEKFTGSQATTQLQTLCRLLEPLTKEVNEHQRSPVQVVVMADERTITDVGAASNLYPKAVSLGEGQYPTIDGLRERPKVADYIEAGAFSAYLEDVRKVFGLLSREGEHFLGQNAFGIVGTINQELPSLISSFNNWQNTQHSDKITRLPLERKDYPTLRKFI